MSDEIIIYTDGGCDPNPGPGGWGVVILRGKTKDEYSGAEEYSTNNRMELTAAIEALSKVTSPSRIILYADSQYVVKGIVEWMPKWLVKNWRGSNGKVANRDLWEALLEVSKPHHITWKWLEGHSGNMYNDRVDHLCHLARIRFKVGG